MQTGQPSRTAWAVARHRAVHQLVEAGRVFTDPLAVRLLGVDPAELAEEAGQQPERRPMRLFLAARSRFAEDCLAAAYADGTRQLVVLGAGLDTFAYRNPHAEGGLRVFEVDHPASQEWKRRRLAEAGIVAPGSLTYVPVDFETATLAEELAAAGFDRDRPSFFSWLGVVPYLSRDAVLATLRFVGALPGGARIVLDYGDPPENLPPERRADHEARALRVAALGEPWLTYFAPEELAAELAALGLTVLNDLGPDGVATRYLGLPPGRVSGAGGHLTLAGSR
ncbi:class I SAM-dependent methyltransferase [Kitasatospora sp. McL0602]|uniref:class I SAM-dependent methyltransferase n=1 Tax=Kitasatospora sp. McL0602 TaxID=3439530 RepID=UPI003F8B060D